jgi:hypothetical protein
MKCSDIPDEHVVSLAYACRDDGGPCVLDALVLEGVPEKVAYAKIVKLVKRDVLDYGTSPRCAWPKDY